MKLPHKQIVRGIIALIIVSGVFLFGQGKLSGLFGPSYIEAVGDLFVDFGVPVGQPMFNISNMKPGDSISKTIIVTNDATSLRPVAIRGIKTNGLGLLENALEVAISKGGTDLYGGTTGIKTLAEFFANSAGPVGIPLTNLTPGQTADYQITVKFKQSAGNEYQQKKVIFTIQIGINIDLPVACQNMNLNANPIYGTRRNDIINGTPGNDLILAFEGNDIVNAGGGNDCVIAGLANDIVNGGGGNDYMEGNAGPDILNGNAGINIGNGGSGQDICNTQTKIACEL